MPRPHLTFFVELASDELVKLFASPAVADFLADGGYGLSMGILDLTAERAEVVRELERRGVPVTAWLLLDVEDGYWLNSDNPDCAVARYRETVEWAAREGLALHRIGLDIEFPRALGKQFNHSPWRALATAFLYRRSFGEVYEAERAYAALVEEIHAGGRGVESYQFPHLLDERATGRALLRRCLGLVNVSVDVEVFMLYSSYLGRSAAHSYFADGGAIALGVTGGGVNAGLAEETPRLLSWERLEDDLTASAHHSDEVYVFSLEGCVWNEFLPRFASIDWQRGAASEPSAAVSRARRNRRWIRWAMRVEPLADLVLPSWRRETAGARDPEEESPGDRVETPEVDATTD